MSMSIFNSGSFLNNLNKYNRMTSNAMAQLSSGYRINKASDDPAGLVISQQLRSQYLGSYQAIRNSQEANNVMGIAEGGLSQISDMLTQMKQLATHAANSGVTSNEQVAADQSELNGMLNAINNISATTSYGSRSLLNGTSSFAAEATDSTSATQTQQSAATMSFTQAGGELTADQDFDITGSNGTQNFSFTAGQSLQDMADEINNAADATGVEAVVNEDTLELVSRDLGAAQSITVDQNTGDAFAPAGSSVTANGADTDLSGAQQGQIVDMAASEFTSGASGAGAGLNVGFSGNAEDQAEKAYVETDFGAGNSTLQTDQEFTVTGNNGSETFSFAAGTSIEDMADVINQSTSRTGVSAYATDDGSELRLTSQDYGSDQSVRVSQTTGDAFAAAGSDVSDTGQDVTVNINGESVTGRGLEVDFNSGDYSGTLSFSAGESSTDYDSAVTSVAQLDYSRDNLTDATTARSSEISTSRGGMQLQLGEGAGGQNRQDFSLPDASLSSLGRITVDGQDYSMQDLFSGGSAALAENPEIAMQVIDQAIEDVSSMRADIGAYQANTLSATTAELEIAAENILATESGISSADMAEQITAMTSNQIMQKVNISVLQKANSSMGNMLKLLGAQ